MIRLGKNYAKFLEWKRNRLDRKEVAQNGKKQHAWTIVPQKQNTLSRFSLEEEHKIGSVLGTCKLFFLSFQEEVHYESSWHKFKSKEEKRDKILYQVFKTAKENIDISLASSRNPLVIQF